ncbi:MAG: hypothetical protein PUD89_04710 [Bacteroidales bacterium]|nr:hypothetical protein [Bacteroidales bacterium]
MKKVLLFFMCASMLYACGGKPESQPTEEQPTEESKNLASSSVVLKGKHANLFQVDGDACKVNLVQVNGDWQVRVKMTIANKKSYNQLSNKAQYQPEVKKISGQLLNASDVEVSALEVPNEEWNMLLAEDVDGQMEITLKTYGYHHYTYEQAKAIYDKVAGVELTNIELEEAKAASDGVESVFDDETKKTINDVQQILEVEGQMLDALQKLM